MAALSAMGLSGCARLGDSFFGSDGLGYAAQRQNKFYGAAAQSFELDDADFTDALRREVNMIVPENELKWSVIRPTQQQFDFSGYHRLAAFAQANGIAMRGHTLLWHIAMPEWLPPALTNRRVAEKILHTHMKRVLTETAPMIRQWDVVNEAIDPRSSRSDGMRASPWLTSLGPDYVALAYNMAHSVNPDLTLVYNDFDLEYDDGAARAKRRLVLKLLEKMRGRHVPVHALGLQSHLQVGRPLGGAGFTEFLADIRALGLNIYITEMDLDLRKLKGRQDEKIAAAQIYARAYLDLVQQEAPVDQLLTWGLSDRYSWLRKDDPDLAGALPLTADLKHGPLWETLRSHWLKA